MIDQSVYWFFPLHAWKMMFLPSEKRFLCLKTAKNTLAAASTTNLSIDASKADAKTTNEIVIFFKVFYCILSPQVFGVCLQNFVVVVYLLKTFQTNAICQKKKQRKLFSCRVSTKVMLFLWEYVKHGQEKGVTFGPLFLSTISLAVRTCQNFIPFSISF